MCGVKGFAARRAAGIGCVNVLHLRNRQAKVAREIGKEGPLSPVYGGWSEEGDWVKAPLKSTKGA